MMKYYAELLGKGMVKMKKLCMFLLLLVFVVVGVVSDDVYILANVNNDFEGCGYYESKYCGLAKLSMTNGSMIFYKKQAEHVTAGDLVMMRNSSYCAILKCNVLVINFLDCSTMDPISKYIILQSGASTGSKYFLSYKNTLWGLYPIDYTTKTNQIVEVDLVKATTKTVMEFTSDCTDIIGFTLDDTKKRMFIYCETYLIELDLVNLKQTKKYNVGYDFFKRFQYYKNRLYGYKPKSIGNNSTFGYFDLEKETNKKFHFEVYGYMEDTGSGVIVDGKYFSQLQYFGYQTGSAWVIIDLESEKLEKYVNQGKDDPVFSWFTSVED